MEHGAKYWINKGREEAKRELQEKIESLDTKQIIDDWYYNEINQAVTIGDISRIELAKKIKEEILKIFKEMGQ